MTVSPTMSMISKQKSGLSHGLQYPVKKELNGLKNASWTPSQESSGSRRTVKSLRATRSGEILLKGIQLSSRNLHSCSSELQQPKMKDDETSRPSSTTAPIARASLVGFATIPNNKSEYTSKNNDCAVKVSRPRTVSPMSPFANEVSSLLSLLRTEEYVISSRERIRRYSQSESLGDIPFDIYVPSSSEETMESSYDDDDEDDSDEYLGFRQPSILPLILN